MQCLPTFNSEGKCSIADVPDGHREGLLTNSKPIAVGPAGYVEGDYSRYSTFLSYGNSQLSLKYPGRSSTGREMAPIEYLTELSEALSDEGKFKMALADACNGYSILIKSPQLVNEQEAYGISKFDTHLSPAAVVVKAD